MTHRQLIVDARERADFDRGWGIVVTREGHVTIDQAHSAEFDAQMKAISGKVSKLLVVMEKATKDAAGAILLRHFLIDLLGSTTIEAQMLQRQFECDDIREVKVVNWALKGIVIALIILADLFMIYSCVLYAFDKGQRWQYRWLINVTYYVVTTIFFYDLVTVLFINVFIPSLIPKKKQWVCEEVRMLVRDIFFKSTEAHCNLKEDCDREEDHGGEGEGDIDREENQGGEGEEVEEGERDNEREEEQDLIPDRRQNDKANRHQQPTAIKEPQVPFSASDFFFISVVSKQTDFYILNTRNYDDSMICILFS